MIAPERQPEEFEQAFAIYCECGSVAQTSRLTGIPQSTLTGHAQKNNWKEMRESALVALPETPVIYLQKVDGFIKELDLAGHDADSFKNIKEVELICMQSIKGIPVNLGGKKVKLAPESFKEAVTALKTCWDAKERLIIRTHGTKDGESRTAKGKEGINVNVNFIDMLRNVSKIVAQEAIDVETQEVED